MIREFVDAWDKYKCNLEKYFKENGMNEYSDYEKIIKLIFTEIINPYIEKDLCDKFLSSYDCENIGIIDYGNYSGDKIFIIPKKKYQLTIEDCIYTNIHYGSCSGCDTLKRIRGYKYSEKPDDNQVKDLMTLSLHLLQKMHQMYDTHTDDDEFIIWRD